MIDHLENAFALRCAGFGDEQPVLADVQAHGRLEGVLFALTLRQTYRNTGPRNIEVVYTFPLPPGAVLLGFAAELNGRRLDGRVLPRRQAERGYEDALAEGDAPVLLEVAAGGLHTANIGNLLPGETIVLELRSAQLLSFDHGRLRLAIPTTIAPRYGRPDQAGLLPHQAPQASLSAEYPLSLSVVVAGSLANAGIDCPTHAVRLTPTSDGMTVALAPGARLDRDVVFIVTPQASRPNLLVSAQDEIGAREGAGLLMLAAFETPSAPARNGATLKLLVDCSGSMAGDSMASARRALHGVIGELRRGDTVSFSRFGTTLERVAPLRPVTHQNVQNLHRQIDATEATLGGTEMASALLALVGHAGSERGTGNPANQGEDAGSSADILLITDGEVWDTRSVLAAARRSGHRIFAIGVGSAPAEDVLRELTQATGGACDFATPGEALERAARRMMGRIRQGAWARLQVDWGTAPRWQAVLPASVFVGSTVLVMAGFAAGTAPATAARLMGAAADEPAGPVRELACASLRVSSEGDSLARMAAAQRLTGLEPVELESLAMAYGLLSRQTHCVLVHRRDGEHQRGDEAELQRVTSMLAAGWGGTGSVTFACRSSPKLYTLFDSLDDGPAFDPLPNPAQFSKRTTAPRVHLAPPLAASPAAASGPQWLDRIAERVAAHLAQGKPLDELLAPCVQADLGGPLANAVVNALANAVANAVAELQALVADPAMAWLLFALWVASRPGEDGNACFAAVLEPHARAIDRSTRDRVNALMARWLDGFSTIDWDEPRQQRLKRSLGAA